MAEENRGFDSGPESQVFASDRNTGNDEPRDGTRNGSRGGEGTIHSLRNAFRTAESGNQSESAHNPTPGTNEPATKRKYTRRSKATDNAAVAAWGDMIGSGLAAWTDVLAESRGPHWQIKEERLNDLGRKYAAIIVHYFPETGGELSIWGAAIMGTGTVFGPPLTHDIMKAMQQAKQQQASRPQYARPPAREYYAPPVQQPWTTPPPSWGMPPPQPPPPPVVDPEMFYARPAATWEPPETINESGEPVVDENAELDLRSVGMAMGLSEEQVNFALAMVQGIAGNDSE